MELELELGLPPMWPMSPAMLPLAAMHVGVRGLGVHVAPMLSLWWSPKVTWRCRDVTGRVLLGVTLPDKRALLPVAVEWAAATDEACKGVRGRIVGHRTGEWVLTSGSRAPQCSATFRQKCSVWVPARCTDLEAS